MRQESFFESFSQQHFAIAQDIPDSVKMQLPQLEKMLNFIVAVMLANITMVYGTYL